MLRKYRPLQKIGRLLERFSDDRIEPAIPGDSSKRHNSIEEMTARNTDNVIPEDHGIYTKMYLEIGKEKKIRLFKILNENHGGSKIIR